MRSRLSDEEWAMVAPLLEFEGGPPSGTGRPRRDARVLLDGILWVLRTGAAWRDLPAEFGPWQTAYDYFARWRDSGQLQRVRDAILEHLHTVQELDRTLACLDGTTIRAAKAAAGGGKERSAGRTKSS